MTLSSLGLETSFFKKTKPFPGSLLITKHNVILQTASTLVFSNFTLILLASNPGLCFCIWAFTSRRITPLKLLLTRWLYKRCLLPSCAVKELVDLYISRTHFPSDKFFSRWQYFLEGASRWFTVFSASGEKHIRLHQSTCTRNSWFSPSRDIFPFKRIVWSCLYC